MLSFRDQTRPGVFIVVSLSDLGPSTVVHKGPRLRPNTVHTSGSPDQCFLLDIYFLM